jgi:hypothetical protein
MDLEELILIEITVQAEAVLLKAEEKEDPVLLQLIEVIPAVEAEITA